MCRAFVPDVPIKTFLMCQRSVPDVPKRRERLRQLRNPCGKPPWTTGVANGQCSLTHGYRHIRNAPWSRGMTSGVMLAHKAIKGCLIIIGFAMVGNPGVELGL